jgi:hypothetical protein
VRRHVAEELEAVVANMGLPLVEKAIRRTRWLSYDAHMYDLFAALAAQLFALQLQDH